MLGAIDAGCCVLLMLCAVCYWCCVLGAQDGVTDRAELTAATLLHKLHQHDLIVQPGGLCSLLGCVEWGLLQDS